MSSILKALRRLEEERARKSSAAPEIAASLLRSGRRRRLTPFWIWPTVITAVVTLVIALLWAWRPAPLPQLTVTPASPALHSRAAAVEQGGAVIIEEVIDPRRPVLLPPAQPPLLRPKPEPEEFKPLPPSRVESAGETPPVTGQSSLPSLEERRNPVVSAIAWQDDSSARMAVVDGLPVMTGESVGNARVQEIRRDHILFAEGGTVFIVYLAEQ